MPSRDIDQNKSAIADAALHFPSLPFQPLIEIQERRVLAGIPSASGIELINGQFFIVGDNSTTLFRLNSDFKIQERVELYRGKPDEAGVISKKRKRDLEAMAAFVYKGVQQIVAFGSGSRSPERDKGYQVILAQNGTIDGKAAVTEIDLARLYVKFRKEAEIIDQGKLNLEGATFTESHFIFVQRRLTKERNAAMYFDRGEFIEWLADTKKSPPDFTIEKFAPPKIGDRRTGFSGLTTIPGTSHLLFSASAEISDDAVDDGVVLGSAIGIIPAYESPLFRSLSIDEKGRADVSTAAVLASGTAPLPLKIESLTVAEVVSRNEVMVYACTDSDGGTSEILKLRVRWTL